MSGAVRAHLPLDVDPDVVPPAAVGIHRGADEFWKHTAGAAAAVDPAEEPRVCVAGSVRQQRQQPLAQLSVRKPVFWRYRRSQSLL